MKYLFTYLSLCILISCGVYKKIRLNRAIEKHLICREKWIYSNLKDSTKIKVLRFNEKGSYDLVHYPNFIIGINKNGDTLGFIDNLSSKKYNIGDTIELCSYDYNDTTSTFPYKMIRTNQNDFIPLIRISTKKKYNDLYCKINKVYYCKIKE